MALVNVTLPFYYRTAVMAVLFPLYVLHAFESDPVRLVAGGVHHASTLEVPDGGGGQAQGEQHNKEGAGAGGVGATISGPISWGSGRGGHQYRHHHHFVAHPPAHVLDAQSHGWQLGLPPAVPTGAPMGAPGLPLFATVLPATNWLADHLVAKVLERGMGMVGGKVKQG